MGFWDDAILCVQVTQFHDNNSMYDVAIWRLSVKSEEALNYFANKFQDRTLLFPHRPYHDCGRTIYSKYSLIFILKKLSCLQI